MYHLVIAEFLNCSQDDVFSTYESILNNDCLDTFDMLTETLAVIKGSLKGINLFLDMCDSEDYNSKLIWHSSNDIDSKIVHTFWDEYNIFVSSENYIKNEYGIFICDENIIFRINENGEVIQRWHNTNNKISEVYAMEIAFEVIKGHLPLIAQKVIDFNRTK